MALSVAQLYEVMAQLPDPVFILSEDGYYIEYIGGVEQQSYQDGNPLIGKRLFDVLPADKAFWVMEQVARALASGQVQVVEYDLSPAEVDGIDVEAGPQGMQRFEGKIAPLPSLYDGKRAVAWMSRPRFSSVRGLAVLPSLQPVKTAPGSASACTALALAPAATVCTAGPARPPPAPVRKTRV